MNDRGITRLLALGIACLLVVACGPRELSVVAPDRQLSVSLLDRTGLVESIGLARVRDIVLSGTDPLAMSNAAPDVVTVAWISGQCDSRTIFELSRDGERFVLGYDLGGACFEQGAIERGIEIRFSEAVRAEAIRQRPRPAAGL